MSEARLADIRNCGLYIMHPGPVNRGVELCVAVMDDERVWSDFLGVVIGFNDTD